MLLVVTSVGLLVHIYSVGYMHGDGGYYRFFSYLPLFVFSMLMLVLADNYLLLFVFWEAVGLCSYLLVGFWFHRPDANNAAMKAFWINRVGDIGFGLGTMLVWTTFGTFTYTDVFSQVERSHQGAGRHRTRHDHGHLPAALLRCDRQERASAAPNLAAGCDGWPDAGLRPHPRSDDGHGGHLPRRAIVAALRSLAVARAMSSPSSASPPRFLAATIGLVQRDIKRVLAYSTVSQLGYMCFALGVGAYIPAIFHLMTHAMFKGLMFLGSGSVIHGMHEEQDLFKMGGLRKKMPITAYTFLDRRRWPSPASPGLAGFWSKDEIIVGSWHAGYPVIAVHRPDYGGADRLLYVPPLLPRLRGQAPLRRGACASARVARDDDLAADYPRRPLARHRRARRHPAGQGRDPHLPEQGDRERSLRGATARSRHRRPSPSPSSRRSSPSVASASPI